MKSRGNNSIIFGLKVQKHLARGRALASPRVNVPYNGLPLGQKRSYALSVRRKIIIILPFATLINFLSANYLTFGGLLSRNAGDFWGSVSVGVDFCEYLNA